MMRHSRLGVFLAVVTLAAVAATPARAAVYAVHDGESSGTSKLYSFTEQVGTSLTTIGDVTLGGSTVFVEGLAQRADGTLYGFVLGTGTAQLVEIDKQTAVATAIGGPLAGYSIRGASFDGGHRLWAYRQITTGAAPQASLLQVDTATGLVVAGSERPLVVGPGSTDRVLAFEPNTDIAFDKNNDLYMVNRYLIVGGSATGGYFEIDIQSGAAVVEWIRNEPGRRGSQGFTFSAGAAENIAFYYQNHLQNGIERGIFRTNRDNNFAVITPTPFLDFNGIGGAGDLAAFIPEPASALLLAFGSVLLWRRRSAG